MARLSTSASSNRPSLVTTKQQLLLTPASTTGIGPLQRAYSASLAHESPSTATRFAKKSPAPSFRSRETPSDNIDIDGPFSDAIDLTEADNNEASSSVLAFGDDVTVWRDDYAERPEPLPPKRGKKRKSEEIANTPSISDDGDEDFPDICDLIESEPQSSTGPSFSSQNSRAQTAPPRKAAVPGSALKERTEACTSSRLLATKRLGSVPPIAVPATGASCHRSARSPSRQSPGSDFSASTRKRKSLSSPSRLGNAFQAQSNNLDEPIKTKKKPRRSEIVADSEDENRFITPLTHRSTARSRMNPDEDEMYEAALMEAELDDPRLVIDTPSMSQPAATLSTTIRGASQHSLPDDKGEEQAAALTPKSQLPSGGRASHELQNPSSSDAERKKNVLGLFLSKPSVVEAKLLHISDQVKRNQEEFVACLRDNVSKEERERVRSERNPLLQKQKALKDVLSEQHTLKDLTKERETLLADLGRAYAEGLDTEEDEVRLENLSSEVQAKEKQLISKLIAGGVEDLDFLKDPNDHMVVPDSPEPVVMATQPSRKSGPPSLSTRESTLIPGYNSQVILQTQAPHADCHSSRKSERIDTMQPPSAPFVRDNWSTAWKPQSYGSSRHVPNNSFANSGGEVLFDDDEMFSELDNPAMPPLRRKSLVKVARMAVPDYFGDDNDDADMLAAAENFERQRSTSVSATDKRRARSVLSEASGNSGRAIKPRPAAKRVTSSQRKASIPPELMKFAWSADVRRALKDRFRMSGFRTNQLEAINATLEGKDAFVLMPTGGGKSLCYQLPAVITSGKTHGVSIVISPLLSLMHDQVNHLEALNVMAKEFNGEIGAEKRRHILDTFASKDDPEMVIQLLYVTPEMMNKSQPFIDALKMLYQKKKLARIIIDEAHCLSQWGHDFRPDYKALGKVRRQFPGVPVMALTATATKSVILDVKHNLGMNDCQVFSQSFNRPNIFYEVRLKETNIIDRIGEMINDKYDGQTGIVYTLSRRSAESIADKLREKHGIKAHHYHASIPSSQKSQVQKDWQSGKIKVVVATIAFGMGIDKPDVRFVIHSHMPKSLEGYYQETGRAGRDGKNSDCYLFFTYGDIQNLRRMIDKGEGYQAQKERQFDMLNRVVAFCENQHACRRVEILQYFGESFNPANCNGACDNCRSGRINISAELQDYTEIAVAALKIVRSKGPLTLGKLVEIMTGKRVKENNSIEHFGIAKKMKSHEVQRIILTLVSLGALGEENRVNSRVNISNTYYNIGPKAWDYLRGKQKFKIAVPNSDGSSWLRVRARADLLGSSEPSGFAGLARSQRPPPSTNVSSPLPAASKKRKIKPSVPAVSAIDEHESDMETRGNGPNINGFEKDEFSDIDEDAFEPVPAHRRLGAQRQPTLDELGPPISRDSRLEGASLDEIHKECIRSFVEHATELEEDLRNKNNIRRAIFTEQQYREMAIRWTTTVGKMYTIRGMDRAKVDRFGAKFASLVKQFHTQYLAMMANNTNAPTVTRTVSGNHDVVDLITDEEDSSGDEDGGEDLELSRYFGDTVTAVMSTPAVVTSYGQTEESRRWNEEFNSLSTQPSRAAFTVGSTKASGSGWKMSNKPSKKVYKRKGGEGYTRAPSVVGVSKRKASGSKRSSSIGGGGPARGRPASGKAGTRRSSAGSSGISMMPI
ncbi:hypothetical protein B0T26DRAFT_684589 [Lasiosphaeria miniovina]|uniref:DNA 3'-5' helicase n=1 Tax=Lasiosphaeria miniovina TaxID=1954250 RepID=A0AA40EFN6_9PEZI|nr:uncharacterized protein B0T26DRAFT_684589 [Lasiosphaeria miniovina]KAK0733488.1 hypothetical protein B0T26DRAFT_684589 [Lasiosphaeria miniovina]